jgi:hypothetical protein
MAPVLLSQGNLDIGPISAFAVHPNGRKVYLGRRISHDPQRENVVVATVDSTGQLSTPLRFYRDSPDALPLMYTSSNSLNQPRSTIQALVVVPRYRKLYVAAQLEDLFIRPARFLSVYDLTEDGDILPGTLRSYRAAPDQLTAPITIENLAVHPHADVLYISGFGAPNVRYYRLDANGEPQGNAPEVLSVGGPSGKRAMGLSANGERMYLGSYPATLEVLKLVDGIPQLPPVKVLKSAVPEVFSAASDNYLRFAVTPGALFCTHDLRSITDFKPPLSLPLFMLPLDSAGDLAAGVTDFQRIEGFEHTMLVADIERRRLWFLRETTQIDTITQQPMIDGVQLVGYNTDAQWHPTTALQQLPKQYDQQGLFAAVIQSTGEPVLLTRPPTSGHPTTINYHAGETLQFKISRAQPAPVQPPLTFKCRLRQLGTDTLFDFVAAEGAQSALVALDPFLRNRLGQSTMYLTFPPAADNLDWKIEVQYNSQGVTHTKTDVVRGNTFVFLLAGYAVEPEQRAAQFELLSDHAKLYRQIAETYSIPPADRPEQFVVSAYGLAGFQGHAAQLDDGVATLRALGFNSVELGNWGSIKGAELAQRYAELSPETGIYAPEFGYFFDFFYDGSLKNAAGTPIDATQLAKWAATLAQQTSAHNGLPANRLVRFQLADEHGWYFPMVLNFLRRDNPLLPNDKLQWSDERKNAAWLNRFKEYVATNDPELVNDVGTKWGNVEPIGASQATTPVTRRLFYWSVRFFSDQAALGAQKIHAALQAAFHPEPIPANGRPEHAKLHIHTNFSETLDTQWYKPYPNAQGDKNPDQGPDAATGGLNWFDYSAPNMPLPFKNSYATDANAATWSFYADLLRSAAHRDDNALPEFGGVVAGSRIGDIPSGAAYKLLALLSRGSKIPMVYAFGPVFLFGPPNGWSDRFDAYQPISEALRLIGRTEHVLYPGIPEQGNVAIHLPVSSRLWDAQQRLTLYTRELMPLHTALIHDGFSVDFIDDARIETGSLATRNYTTLYLIGPNLSQNAQRAVRTWVENGGTLVVLPGAGSADEFNNPTTIIDALLGIAPRAAWLPIRELASNSTSIILTHQLSLLDPRWSDPLLVDAPINLRALGITPPPSGTLVKVDFPELQPVAAVPIATMRAHGSDTSQPAITMLQHGKGRAYAYAFYPGWQYWSTATHNFAGAFSGRLPHGWKTSDRLLATLPTRLANTRRFVVTSHPGVEARRLQSKSGIAIVLFNWTGAPIENLTVLSSKLIGFDRISSAKHGPLVNHATDRSSLTVKLPLEDVDIILIEN